MTTSTRRAISRQKRAGEYKTSHFETRLPIAKSGASEHERVHVCVEHIGLAAPFKLWTCDDDYIVVRETWLEMPVASYIPGESISTT